MKAAAVVFLLVSYSTLISAMKITIAGREYVTGVKTPQFLLPSILRLTYIHLELHIRTISHVPRLIQRPGS